MGFFDSFRQAVVLALLALLLGLAFGTGFFLAADSVGVSLSTVVVHLHDRPVGTRDSDRVRDSSTPSLRWAL